MIRSNDKVLHAFERRWALFLDVDGTLLRLAEHPGSVHIEPQLISTLEQLQVSAGGALALVSGRRLSDLDALFEPLELPASGLHGLERRDAEGRVTRHGFDENGLASVRQTLSGFARRHKGAFVEDKGASLALHFRSAPSASSSVDAFAAELARELPAALRLQRGKMVIEVTSEGKTKGTAIAEFMNEEPFRGRRAVFLGDDVTDEDGFRWVEAHEGISIKVGPGETAAQFRLHDEDAVIRWLGSYLAFLQKEALP